MIRRRFVALTATFAGALALAAALLPVGTVLAAKPGDFFALNALDMPAGAIPASHSGASTGGHSASALSADGRFLAFVSMAEALAPGSNADVLNVYRKDRATGQVVLISRATGSDGAGAGQNASEPKISLDGNIVAFTTEAKLSPADTNDEDDIYVRNVAANTTTLAQPGLATGTDSDFDLSGDGQWISFSTEDALLPADTNTTPDVYRRHLPGNTTDLVSVNSGGAIAANGDSTESSISDDGRWVAFTSKAANVVAGFADGGDPSGSEVYVRDMTAAPAGSSTLVSSIDGSATTGGDGTSNRPMIASTAASLSQLKIAFASFATNIDGPSDPDTASADSVYLRDFSLAPTHSILVSRLNGPAGANANSRAHVTSISADGSRVAFASDADNIRPGPGYYGVYVRDLDANETKFVADNFDYTVKLALSADGLYAAWTSAMKATPDADGYTADVYGRTLGAGSIANLGAIEHLSRPAGTSPYLAPAAPLDIRSIPGAHTLSADARYALLVGPSDRLAGTPPGDENVVMRQDVATGETVVVSRANGANGAVARAWDPSISADGNVIAFTTSMDLDPADTNGTADIYVRDFAAGTTRLVSRANGVAGAVSDGGAMEARISGNGRRVIFISDSGNLGAPAGREHLYMRDLVSSETIVADRASGVAGTIGNSDTRNAGISDDGRLVAFTSSSVNLHPDDAAAGLDLYVRDLSSHQTTLESRQPGTAGAKLSSLIWDPVISGDGRFVAFSTDDADAVPGTGPWGSDQVVRRELGSGNNVLVSRVGGGGPVGDARSERLAISTDGSKISFVSSASNLLPGLSGVDRPLVMVSDLSAGGALVGPPAFGLPGNDQGVVFADLSGDGRCLKVAATGHNQGTGPLGDWPSAYMYVREGDCHRPEPVPDTPVVVTPKPRLSSVSLKPKRFAVSKKKTARVAAATGEKGAASVAKKKAGGKRGGKKRRVARGTVIRFRLNTRATVRIGFQKRVFGLKRKISRKARRAGAKGKFTCRRAPARKVKRAAAKRRCPLWRPAGAIARRNRAAGRRHKVRFSGRIGRRALKPGRYRAVLKARTDTARSRPVRRSFRVVR